MAQSKEFLPSQKGWIHELANAEIHPDAEKILQLGRSHDPQRLVEESTIDFLSELRETFSEYSRYFNSYSGEGKKFHEVKIYGVAQTPADFMIYRNQIKLIVSNSAQGVIQLSFAKHVQNRFSVASTVNGQPHHFDSEDVEKSVATSFGGKPQELLAQVGPFRDVFWTYQGEKVRPEQIAKFYFVEFVRVTRKVNPSKAGNDLLLEQIKSLLQQKGIDL